MNKRRRHLAKRRRQERRLDHDAQYNGLNLVDYDWPLRVYDGRSSGVVLFEPMSLAQFRKLYPPKSSIRIYSGEIEMPETADGLVFAPCLMILDELS